MGVHYVTIVLPVHPEVVAAFFGAIVLYLAYALVKVVVSLWTGA